MTRKDYFKYAKKTYDENLEYHIVAIPYMETKKSHTCYMVYLVPLNADADLSRVWNDFYSISNDYIRYFIINLDFKMIDLHIPTLDHHQSSFNLIDLLYDVFKYNTSSNLHSSMVAYLKIDEHGGEENGPIMENFTDESIEKPCIKANIPHISFVYDDDCRRILFITKDAG